MTDDDDSPKRKQRKYKRWQNDNNKDFRCGNCVQMVFAEAAIGTTQRNHCNHCLWSLHVDTKPGNRASDCHARMEPVALTFKHDGNERLGDIMLVHSCKGCGEVNINRIAGDDSDFEIINVFERSLSLDKAAREMLSRKRIVPLQKEDREHLEIALYGAPQRPSESAPLTRSPKTSPKR